LDGVGVDAVAAAVDQLAPARTGRRMTAEVGP
ncbi:MAG: hypothetical protein QOI42_2314, partial [Frankiaceae bacterium]|nr:hypothetical protein [Frankiaceae bacterium]